MSSSVPTSSGNGARRKHVLLFWSTCRWKEFTLRAVLLGLLMTVVLGAANAYLGLRAGIDHRRYVSRRSDCDGGYAGMEGIAARRKYRPNRRLDRRVGSRPRHFHSAGVSSGQSVAIVSFRRRLLEIHRADNGGQHSRRSLHFSGAPRHGRRSRTAFPRIFSGI